MFPKLLGAGVASLAVLGLLGLGFLLRPAPHLSAPADKATSTLARALNETTRDAGNTPRIGWAVTKATSARAHDGRATCDAEQLDEARGIAIQIVEPVRSHGYDEILIYVRQPGSSDSRRAAHPVDAARRLRRDGLRPLSGPSGRPASAACGARLDAAAASGRGCALAARGFRPLPLSLRPSALARAVARRRVAAGFASSRARPAPSRPRALRLRRLDVRLRRPARTSTIGGSSTARRSTARHRPARPPPRPAHRPRPCRRRRPPPRRPRRRLPQARRRARPDWRRETRERRPGDRARCAARLPCPPRAADRRPTRSRTCARRSPRSRCAGTASPGARTSASAAASRASANACCTARMPSCMLIGDGGSASSSSASASACPPRGAGRGGGGRGGRRRLDRLLDRCGLGRRRRRSRATRRACCGPRASASPRPSAPPSP